MEQQLNTNVITRRATLHTREGLLFHTRAQRCAALTICEDSILDLCPSVSSNKGHRFNAHSIRQPILSSLVEIFEGALRCLGVLSLVNRFLLLIDLCGGILNPTLSFLKRSSLDTCEELPEDDHSNRCQQSHRPNPQPGIFVPSK